MRLPAWQRVLVFAAIGLLAGTGAGWLVCHHLLSEAGEYGPLPHPLEGAWLALHGAAALLAWFALGSLWLPHVLRGWSVGRNRASGAATASVLLGLGLTGYGLYYVGDDTWREWIATAHWGVGLALPILVAGHIVWGRRSRPEPLDELD